MYYEQRGAADGPAIVFAHGWGRDHSDFNPVAELLDDAARIVLLDLPGFGKSPRPDTAWTTADYADAVRRFLADELDLTRYIWVGHSFGGRIGLRLAAMEDCPLDHLMIVAGAGVKRPRALAEQIRGKWRGWKFRRAKARARSEDEIIALEKRFGSADYVQSRETGLRDIFIRTVEEDQSAQLSRIACPTTLLYGGLDTETPPEIGRILHRGIARSTYLECPAFDHISILSRGRHQITTMLLETLEGRAP